MNRSLHLHRLQFLADTSDAAAAAAMSSRPTYRGGRSQPRRRFSSDRHDAGGGGYAAADGGDLHTRPTSETNLGFRHGGSESSATDSGFHHSFPAASPHFNGNRQFRHPPRQHSQHFYQNQHFRPPPQFQARGGGNTASGGGGSRFQPAIEPNLGFRHGESGSSANNSALHRSLPSAQNRQFRPRPQFGYRQPLPFEHNQAPQRRPQFRPRPPDYRTWELAKTAPSSLSAERFTVLSYNILADYLALDHRPSLYHHIPHHMLDWQWRKRNLIFELGLWSTDIICFQEVDRFQDLEEELNRRGYNGIWKMRTGKPIDGCAIFWRTTRFKLIHEESIEFNEFGLRDNVAQICVLELISQKSGENAGSPLTGSTGSKKVVICNIHVLYNPKRGDIKLGQVRRLLHRAHAVSQIWDDAPIVLCGDFNCVPKSPLYNYISEQKLDLSGLDRDKVSGQASAEIRTQRTYNTSPSFQSAENAVPGPPTIQPMEDGTEQNAPLSDGQKSYHSGSSEENVPSVNFSEREPADTAYYVSSPEVKHKEDEAKIDELKEETQLSSVDIRNIDRSAASVPGAGFREKIDVSLVKGGSSVSHFSDEVPRISPPPTSHPGEVCIDSTEIGHRGKLDSANLGLFSRDLDEEPVDPDNHFPSAPGVSHSAEIYGLENQISQQMLTDDQVGFSSQQSQSHTASTATIGVQEKLDSSSLINSDGAVIEGETVAEDSSTYLEGEIITENSAAYLPALQKCELTLPLESDSSNGLTSASHNSSQSLVNNAVEDDISQDLDREPFDVEQNFYDPASWASWEIETATGNANCTSLEHPLKLRSTYTEAEDTMGIRDSDGEPVVTSYHKRFMGTVDYIWRSEGLQTLRVLAPIPKHVMQTSSGFPTRKWGSDHIALATELAFVEDETKPNHS